MFAISDKQLSALSRDASRRVREEWAASFRANGMTVKEDTADQVWVVTDPGGGVARVRYEEDGVSVFLGKGSTDEPARKFCFRYNDFRSLSKIVDPGGLEVTFGYDERRRLASVTRGNHGTYGFLYDSADALAALRYPDGKLCQFRNDAAGRLIAATDRNGNSRYFSYADNGLVSCVIGPRGDTTSIFYDSHGSISHVEDPIGGTHTYQYGADGAMQISFAEPGAKESREVLKVIADPEGASQEFRYPEGRVRFEYADGRLTSAENNDCTVALSYDEAGFLKSEETVLKGERTGRKVVYKRNQIGAIVGIEYPGAQPISYIRDTENRLRSALWGGRTWTIEYAPSGAMRSIGYPNGVRAIRECEELGNLRTLRIDEGSRDIIPEIRWTYDSCDRVITEKSGDVERSFGYDDEGRLIGVTDGSTGEAIESWDLDPNGNRKTVGQDECIYDAADRLVSFGGVELQYDSAGNQLTGRGPAGRITFGYNGRGQLIQADTAGRRTTYLYDPFGRRIRKSTGDSVVDFTWAGQWLLAETETLGDQTIRTQFLVAPDLGVPLALDLNGFTYYVHHGRRFEPVAVSDQSRCCVWRAEWTSFGAARIDTQPNFAVNHRLPGQYFDVETGLHYSCARYYDPVCGRFLQRDPLGHEGGCWNEYIYCGGDPLNRSDPAGEFIWVLAGAVALGAIIGGGAEAIREYRAGKGFHPGTILKEAAIGGTVALVGAAAMLTLAPAATAVLGSAVAGTVAAAGVSAAIQTCAAGYLTGHVPTAGEMLANLGLAAGTVLGLGAISAALDSTAVSSEEAAARAAAIQRDAEEGGHAWASHGSDVTEEQHLTRIRTGVAPDGRFSPTRVSTNFASAKDLEETRAAAFQQIELENDVDLSRPPAPGSEGPYETYLEHGRPVGTGFVGQSGTEQEILSPTTGRPRTGWADAEPVEGLTGTRTTVKWNAKTNTWDTIQHFPSDESLLGSHK